MDLKKNVKFEEALYEQVAIEISNGQIKQGLWLKSIVDSDDNETRAKVLYTKYRIKQLKREIEEEKEAQLIIQANNEAKYEAEMIEQGIYFCPFCKSKETPKKIPKGNTFIEALLYLFFIIPGLLYMIAMSGCYKYVCPKCERVISRDFIR